MTVNITISINDEVLEKMDGLKKRLETSRSEIIRNAISFFHEYPEKLESIFKWEESRQAWIKHHSNSSGMSTPDATSNES